MTEIATSKQDPAIRRPDSPRSFPRVIGPCLLVWVSVQGGLWVSGVRAIELSTSVESGAAEVERRAVGEIGEDETREAIATQRDSLRFWRALAWVRDFVIGPLGLVARTAGCAVVFAAIAVLRGAPPGFDAALRQIGRAQWFWVAGLAVRAALILALRRDDVETSAVLFLPPGPHPATTWLALREVEPFALAGWLAIALGARRRGQAPLAVAVLIVGLIAGLEVALRLAAGLVLGASVRQTLIPDA